MKKTSAARLRVRKMGSPVMPTFETTRVDHPGPLLVRLSVAPCLCAGAGHDEDRELPVDNYYAIEDRQEGNNIYLCPPCAMKLAIKIFEVEGL